MENCLEEEDMDVGNTETEKVEVAPPKTFSFSDIQVNYLEIKDENAKLKENLEEKENFILELEKKIKNLEKDIKKYETDIDKAKTECTDAIGKASDLCEENTLLLEQVRTYKNIENANAEIQEAYAKIISVEKVTQEVLTDFENENYNIEAIVISKNSGFRRSSPGVAPTLPPMTENIQPRKCETCNYQAKDEDELKTHIGLKHNKCELCSRIH